MFAVHDKEKWTYKIRNIDGNPAVVMTSTSGVLDTSGLKNNFVKPAYLSDVRLSVFSILSQSYQNLL